MSSPERRNPLAEVSERPVCMCVHGGACSVFASGHALHLIQARLAAATPTGWRDAVVEAADAATGELTLRALDNETRVAVWNAAGAAAVVVPGTPVALHGRYDVLSVGRRTFNVAPIRINAA